MSSANEASRQTHRRVLLLFGFSILPPLFLLTILAVVAAQNDEAALNYVEQQRAEQAAAKAQRGLGIALRSAEEIVFRALADGGLTPKDPDGLRRTLAQAEREHPFARHLFVLDDDAQPLWPSADVPFLPEGAVQAPPHEPFNATDQDYRRRAELQILYDRSLELQRAGRLEEAARGFREVAESPESTTTRACRSGFRLGECLRALGRIDAAQVAFQRAARAPIPVRGEVYGRPLRVEALLARAELALEADQNASAGRRAHELAQDLLDGVRRLDVREGEWEEALERIDGLLVAANMQVEREALQTRRAAILSRLRWLRVLEREVPLLLADATEGSSEIRTYATRARPPAVLAYRRMSTPGGELLAGFQLDLDRLGQDVLEPACVTIGLEHDVFLEVLDADEHVRASGGATLEAAGVLGSGRGLQDTQSLDPLPWQVRVTRPTVALEQARRNRLLLYASLIGLTLLSALAGAVATIRYVQRSLELAKMKSDFLSNMTHELKTPLTSIKMYGEMLAAGRLRKEEKRREYAEHIVREGDRLQKLIENVLDFARQDSGKHEYVLAEEDVAEVVSEAIDLFRLSAKARGFDLFVELPPVQKLPPVDLDRDAIVRSVLNLLSNAVKYSTEKRYLKVTVWRQAKDMIGISVEDKGIGIDPEDLEKVFDRFYRAGDELTRGISGTGLGLALVDHIVRAHSGQIRVESERGRGSVFTILLPVVEDYREQWPPPQSIDPDDPLAKTVEADEETSDV